VREQKQEQQQHQQQQQQQQQQPVSVDTVLSMGNYSVVISAITCLLILAAACCLCRRIMRYRDGYESKGYSAIDAHDTTALLMDLGDTSKDPVELQTLNPPPSPPLNRRGGKGVVLE